VLLETQVGLSQTSASFRFTPSLEQVSRDEAVSLLHGLVKPTKCSAQLARGIVAVTCETVQSAEAEATARSEVASIETALRRGGRQVDQDSLVLLIGRSEQLLAKWSDIVEWLHSYRFSGYTLTLKVGGDQATTLGAIGTLTMGGGPKAIRSQIVSLW
jgi:hypothetical protein